jgi:hypothetical protein
MVHAVQIGIINHPEAVQHYSHSIVHFTLCTYSEIYICGITSINSYDVMNNCARLIIILHLNQALNRNGRS